MRSNVKKQVRDQILTKVKTRMWDDIDPDLRDRIVGMIWDPVWLQSTTAIRDLVNGQVRSQMRDEP